MLSEWIKSQGFDKSDCDPCLYIGKDKGSVIFFHVDDLLVAGDVDRFKKAFLSKFNNSSAHKPNTLLGMKVEREKGLIHLSLPLHIEKGLIKMNLTDCRGASTPLTPGSHLKPADDEDHKRFIQLNTKYRSPIGRLNFIAGLARPDISFAVSNLAKFCKKPGLSHWNKIIRVWKYLGNTKDI